MPLVRIDLLAGRPRSEIAAIAECVHDALGRRLGVPEHDRFQVITQHDGDALLFDPSYLGFRRTRQWLLVHVFLAEGRTTEAKRSFYSDLHRQLEDAVGLPGDDLTVVLSENTREDWSFGNGRASYLEIPPEEWK